MVKRNFVDLSAPEIQGPAKLTECLRRDVEKYVTISYLVVGSMTLSDRAGRYR
jgi:hypothetical protein